MRVLITGGTGHIGKTTSERLREKGWSVRILDLAASTDIAGVEYVQGDILDFDSLVNHVQGCDAIIHLAAIRAPSIAPKHQVFQVNVAGTFNVFEAAAATGIKRVVQASSINALGGYYSTGDIRPQYLPIDEEHPTFTTDPYSFSKNLIEEIGAYYWRRDGMSSVAMRFPGVYGIDGRTGERFEQYRASVRGLLDELMSKPKAEREARLNEVRGRVLELRTHRPLEYRSEQATPFRLKSDDLLFKLYMADRFDFWAFIDVRDAAQSLEKGVTATYEGSHALFVNAAYNSMGYDSRALAEMFYPEVTQFKRELSDATSLVSIEKARALIGFEPEYR
jgi:nucleoside-diphosphate-sugar epimerase